MKHISALLTTVLFATSLAYCSNGDKPFRRVYFGVSVTPGVNYRYLVSNFVPTGGGSSVAGNNAWIAETNKQSYPGFGINVADKVGINLTQWLAIETGFGNSFMQYGNNFPDNPANLSKTISTEKYDYITIPIGLRFSIGHSKLRGVITAGADLDILVQQKEHAIYYDDDGKPITNGVTNNTRSFKTFNVSPYFGAGIDCYLTPAVVLRIMPLAQMQALMDNNSQIGEYLWNAGINVSILFGVK